MNAASCREGFDVEVGREGRGGTRQRDHEGETAKIQAVAFSVASEVKKGIRGRDQIRRGFLETDFLKRRVDEEE